MFFAVAAETDLRMAGARRLPLLDHNCDLFGRPAEIILQTRPSPEVHLRDFFEFAKLAQQSSGK